MGQTQLIPYGLGSPFLAAHTVTGESLFGHIRPTQDNKTVLLRQFQNNVRAINHGRYVYDPANCEEEDVLTPTAGGGIRSRNPSQSVVPLVVPDVSQGILAALDYEDKMRTERGGASLDMLGSNQQLASETAFGMERQYGARELLVSMFAKNLGETMIRDTWLLMHEYLRRFSDGPMMVKQAGQWVETDPRSWPKRKRLNVNTGMTPGQRAALQTALQGHVQLQIAAIGQGASGQLADFQTLYNTQMDALQLAGAQNPDRYMIDPASPRAMEAAQQQQEGTQKSQAVEREGQKKLVELEYRKLDNDARKHAEEMKFKYYDADLKAEVKGAEIGSQAELQLVGNPASPDR